MRPALHAEIAAAVAGTHASRRQTIIVSSTGISYDAHPIRSNTMRMETSPRSGATGQKNKRWVVKTFPRNAFAPFVAFCFDPIHDIRVIRGQRFFIFPETLPIFFLSSGVMNTNERPEMTSPWRAGASAKAVKREIKEG